VKTENPTLRRQVLGEQLRVLRRQSRLTLHEAGRVINCSESKLSRVETGHRSASIEDITILLGLYRADPAQRSYVLALARDADELDWKESKDPTVAHCQHILQSLQSQANQIVSFDPVFIPRLLQTNEYRSAILAASATMPTSDINRDRHGVSAPRQPPTLLAFVEEHVLHRPLGNPEILGHQLEHLRETVADSDSTIRVIPKDQAVACGPFTLLRLPDRPPVVVLELLTCRLFLERPEAIDAYEHALKHLGNNALNEAESLKLIAGAAEALDT
jgi:transcriptional regulator with XRE-family HTH domain